MSHSITLDFDHFLKTHFIIPFSFFIIVFTGLEFSSLDLKISEHFYNSSLHLWPYKDTWLTQTVLHKGGQAFSKIMGGVVLFFLLLSLSARTPLHRYRRALLFLFVAAISGPIIIAILKSNTYVYCPWDLKQFGGDQPYIRLFDFVPVDLKVGHCFPSGHAGGGFTFLCLYFFLMVVKPPLKNIGLLIGLLLGLTYGIDQQLRGAHFLSHDIVAAAICWLASLSWFLLIFRKRLQWV